MKSRFSILAALLLFVTLNACDWNSGYQFRPPDFTTVPAPYDTTSAQKFNRADGLNVYTLNDGSGDFTITEIDRIYVYYTLRTMNGKIQESTYANGNTTTPAILTMSSLIRGFREGLLNKKAGAKVVLIVPPALGYGNNSTHQFRNDTLRFDVDIISIYD